MYRHSIYLLSLFLTYAASCQDRHINERVTIGSVQGDILKDNATKIVNIKKITNNKETVKVYIVHDKDSLSSEANIRFRWDSVNNALEFWPIYGSWNTPFFALPESDDSSFIRFAGPLMCFWGKGSLITDGYDNTTYRIYPLNAAPPGSFSSHIYVLLKKLPSHFAIGSLENGQVRGIRMKGENNNVSLLYP